MNRLLAALLVLALCSNAHASYVQGTSLTNGSTTGNAGASLTSVGAGHGLYAPLVFNGTQTPGITSVTDSAGTAWTVGVVVALPNAGESIAFAYASGTVTAGTHTITVNFTGGFACSSMLIEDTLATLRAAAIGQMISSPGSGQTLNPGGSVGNSGDLVYLFALDDAGATTSQQPVAGTGGFTIPAALTGNNTNVGCSWAGGYNASAGATTPTMATGSSGHSDEHGVIAFALTSGGGGSGAPTKNLPLMGVG